MTGEMMTTETMTPADVHRDAVHYLGALRRARTKMVTRMAVEHGHDARVTGEVVTLLDARIATAWVDVETAHAALLAARPACCQDNPVPHEPSAYCQSGRFQGRKHCSCDRCW